jgi:hypothetical protein
MISSERHTAQSMNVFADPNCSSIAEEVPGVSRFWRARYSRTSANCAKRRSFNHRDGTSPSSYDWAWKFVRQAEHGSAQSAHAFGMIDDRIFVPPTRLSMPGRGEPEKP